MEPIITAEVVAISVVTAARTAARTAAILLSLIDARRSLKMLDSVRIEVKAISEILETMSMYQFDNLDEESFHEESWRAFTHPIRLCGDTLQEIIVEVEKILGLGNSSIRHHRYKYFSKVPGRRLDYLVKQLDRHKSTLTVVLSGLMR